MTQRSKLTLHNITYNKGQVSNNHRILNKSWGSEVCVQIDAARHLLEVLLYVNFVQLECIRQSDGDRVCCQHVSVV